MDKQCVWRYSTAKGTYGATFMHSATREERESAMTVRRLVCAAGFASCVMAVSALAPAGVHAQLATCRSDPVITLTDHRVLDMSVMIRDISTDVAAVKYVLHGPQGVSIITETRTPSFTWRVESFAYIADQPANTYVMDTTVLTYKVGVGVTASTALVSLLTSRTIYISDASGLAGTTIAMPFHDNPLL